MTRLTRALRGQVPANTTERIICDDGVFTDGWVVTDFRVFTTSIATGDDTEGLLAIDEDGCTGAFDASDSRQIGWSFFFIGANGGAVNSFIAPNHVVVRDLFVENFSGVPMNYVIDIERRTLTDDQAILALIQERSQDDL